MEEDIEQIKSSLEELETERDDIQLKCIKAELELSIENLLTRYKQLEEENKSKQKAYDDCYCEYKHYKQFDSIPTSLIKEKIEELKEAYEDSKDENGESQYYYPDYTIRVLEELLEKRK